MGIKNLNCDNLILTPKAAMPVSGVYGCFVCGVSWSLKHFKTSAAFVSPF